MKPGVCESGVDSDSVALCDVLVVTMKPRVCESGVDSDSVALCGVLVVIYEAWCV